MRSTIEEESSSVNISKVSKATAVDELLSNPLALGAILALGAFAMMVAFPTSATLDADGATDYTKVTGAAFAVFMLVSVGMVALGARV